MQISETIWLGLTTIMSCIELSFIGIICSKFHLDDLKTLGEVLDTINISPADQPINGCMDHFFPTNSLLTPVILLAECIIKHNCLFTSGFVYVFICFHIDLLSHKCTLCGQKVVKFVCGQNVSLVRLRADVAQYVV